MFPSYLLFLPDEAKATLNYRIAHMDAARDRASSGNYQGAR
jgi:trehalose/maltose hydrolase-like predicted phosphorylase